MSNPFYNSGFTAVPETLIRSSRANAEYAAVAVGFDAVNVQMLLRSAKAGDTYTGAHNFTGATMTVATPTVDANPATKAYVDLVRTYATGLSFSPVLPDQAGNSGKFVTTDGTQASWAQVYPTQTGNVGKVLRTDGAVTSWGWPQLPLATVTGTTHTATAGTLCVLTNVAVTTVTLPASPAVDDVVQVMPANGLYTNVINGNGKNINGDTTITIDNAWACVTVRYISIAIGWRIM
jgi:hypothetical protein